MVEGFLVVRFRIGGGSGRPATTQPLGPGDFVSVLPQLEADARAHGQRLRLAGLDEAACAHLRSAAGEEYALASDPATDDCMSTTPRRCARSPAPLPVQAQPHQPLPSASGPTTATRR